MVYEKRCSNQILWLERLPQENTQLIILTYYSDGYSTVSNPVLSICGKGWSKALHQCAIQWEGCRTSQCWCERCSTGSWTKPSPRPSSEFIIWPTPYTAWYNMWQGALKGSTYIHSPDSNPIPIPKNSTPESEGITRTGGRSSDKLPTNITCICR